MVKGGNFRLGGFTGYGIYDNSQRPIAELASKIDHSEGYFQQLSHIKVIESSILMERAMGIEPTSEAWEASILPLYDARSSLYLLIIHN
jgi:hypothetical protein